MSGCLEKMVPMIPVQEVKTNPHWKRYSGPPKASAFSALKEIKKLVDMRQTVYLNGVFKCPWKKVKACTSSGAS